MSSTTTCNNYCHPYGRRRISSWITIPVKAPSVHSFLIHRVCQLPDNQRRFKGIICPYLPLKPKGSQTSLYILLYFSYLFRAVLLSWVVNLLFSSASIGYLSRTWYTQGKNSIFALDSSMLFKTFGFSQNNFVNRWKLKISLYNPCPKSVQPAGTSPIRVGFLKLSFSNLPREVTSHHTPSITIFSTLIIMLLASSFPDRIEVY